MSVIPVSMEMLKYQHKEMGDYSNENNSYPAWVSAILEACYTKLVMSTI